MNNDWKNGGFGIYIHWPFCESKCPYCDFNSHVSKNIDQNLWAEAYVSELNRYAKHTGDRILNSVFFGGGTPSLMSPEIVNRILENIRQNWRTTNNPEITLEANPSSVEAGRFEGYKNAGVNRISLGIQALNNHDLQKLGRLHTVDEALNAFDIARTYFDRVSFDLIYARQNQTLNEWRNELTQALNLAVDHLSMYQLTIEDGTAFGNLYNIGKLRGLPNDDIAASMYDITQDICEKHGFPAYEISNHAKSDAESIHNKIYWNYGDYIGIGPGAHGRLTIENNRYATEAYRNPNIWLSSVKSKGLGESIKDLIRPEDQVTEFLLMGMRLSKGVCITRLKEIGGEYILENAKNLTDQGFIKQNAGHLSATTSGRPILNVVLRELLID